MAFTGVIGPPQVVQLGGATVTERYKANTEADLSAGDFLRITSDTGEVEVTDIVDTGDTGGLEAMAISDFDASEDGNIFIPVLMITPDTVFRQQVSTGTPAVSDIGSLATLDLTTGKMAPTDTTTNGVVEIVDVELRKRWWLSDEDVCGAYGVVYFKIISEILLQDRIAAT